MAKVDSGSPVGEVPSKTQPPPIGPPPVGKHTKNLMEQSIPSIISLGIAVVVLAFGIRYKNECPVERMIPIFCIVYGSFSIVVNLMEISRRVYQINALDDEKSTHPRENLIYIFLFVWLIVGSVYIYKVKSKVNTEDSEDPNYCNGTLYWDAFWFVSIANGLMGLLLVFVCCGILQDFYGKKEENELPKV